MDEVQDDPEVSAETDVEVEAPESEPESPPEPESQPDKKADAVQDRINKLTRNWRQTERENADLKAQIEQLRTAPPKADDKLKTLDDFDGDVEGYFNYREQRLQAEVERQFESRMAQVRGQTEEQRAYSTYLQREAAFAGTVDDYHETVAPENWACSKVMASEIHQSEVGPQLTYHLAKNPDVALEIAQLPERAQIRRMAQLEARLQAPKPKDVSKAPPPPTELKGAKQTTRVSTRDPKSDKLSDAEWLKRRNAELAKQG